MHNATIYESQKISAYIISVSKQLHKQVYLPYSAGVGEC